MGANDQKDPELRVCAWCNVDLETNKIMKSETIRELCDQDKVTHGVCEPCRQDIMNVFGVTSEELDSAVEIAST